MNSSSCHLLQLLWYVFQESKFPLLDQILSLGTCAEICHSRNAFQGSSTFSQFGNTDDETAQQPRSYLEDRHWMTSALLLLQPSEFEYQRVKNAIASAGSDEYDMEILNGLYKRSCLVLPHRPYFILTREFTSVEDHSYWLGSKEESWDPETVLKEAKYIHFSDWPTPKVSCRKVLFTADLRAS